jgi:arylsulfatase A-like enzyme/Flp pilus assembly protein TadD
MRFLNGLGGLEGCRLWVVAWALLAALAGTASGVARSAEVRSTTSSPRVAAPVAPTPSRPDVLLITVDTLRPDALGWVAGENDTPALDALARSGFRFPAAVSPVPLTLPAHTSILTALVPRRHGVRDNGQVFPTSGPGTLGERLGAAGYTTAAFVSGFPLLARFGLDRGFEHYDDHLPEGPEGWIERRGGDTTQAVLAWAATAPRPWFVWVHYYDPHDPYDPPRAFWRPGRRGLYDGEVASTDNAIGKLLRGLDDVAPGQRLTVFTADHAESLGEHGEQTHGYFVYDTTMVVPLVFHQPGRIAAGESAAAARLVDLAPTVLDLLGLPGLPRADGVSLAPTLAGGAQEIPPAYLESRQPWIAYGWAPLAAIRHGGWKLIAAPRPELYDLGADPGEGVNRVDAERRRARALQVHLRAAEAEPAARSEATNDPEVLAELRALGYLGSGGGDRDVPTQGLDDPKDRLVERDLCIAAETRLRAGDLQAALVGFGAVLERDPNNRYAVLRSGIVHLKAGNAAAALPWLERAVVLDPEQAETRFALADALTRLGRLEQAAKEWMETVRLQPRRAAAWSNLGTVLGRSGEINRAVSAFQRAFELDPDDPRLLGNLGAAQRAAGMAKEALINLERAAALWTDGAFPHAADYAALLRAAGRSEEARRWELPDAGRQEGVRRP